MLLIFPKQSQIQPIKRENTAAGNYSLMLHYKRRKINISGLATIKVIIVIVIVIVIMIVIVFKL